MGLADNTEEKKENGSALKLVSILRGEFDMDPTTKASNDEIVIEETEKPEKINFFREGVKLDNHAMRVLLERLREKYNYDDGKLLQIYLLFDQSVEEGVLSQEIIDNVQLNN